VQDLKQRYTGLAPAVAQYSTSPQSRSIRPTPHLDSDLLSDEEDLATLSYNSMSQTPVVATPLPHTDPQYDDMPLLIAQSDDEDSDSDSGPDSGSEADTDPGDDESDAEVIYNDPMPALVDLSDSDSDSEADIDDDATDTMSVESDAADLPILPLQHDDDSDDDDEPDTLFPLEDNITSNTPARVRLNTLQPLQQSQDPTLASFMLTTVELLHEGVLLAAGSCMLDTGALQASYIRQDALDNSPQLRSLQRSCSVDVLLGDDAEETKETVSSYVPITIRLPDSKGNPHEAHSIWLLVMPTLGVDVIIGLPHLVRNFSQCFTSHLMAAIIASHTDKASNPNVATMLSNLHTIHRSQRQSLTGPLDTPQPSLAIAGDRRVAVLSINVNGFNAACG
jgi:hypothetical protein